MEWYNIAIVCLCYLFVNNDWWFLPVHKEGACKIGWRQSDCQRLQRQYRLHRNIILSMSIVPKKTHFLLTRSLGEAENHEYMIVTVLWKNHATWSYWQAINFMSHSHISLLLRWTVLHCPFNFGVHFKIHNPALYKTKYCSWVMGIWFIFWNAGESWFIFWNSGLQCQSIGQVICLKLLKAEQWECFSSLLLCWWLYDLFTCAI